MFYPCQFLFSCEEAALEVHKSVSQSNFDQCNANVKFHPVTSVSFSVCPSVTYILAGRDGTLLAYPLECTGQNITYL